MDKEIGILLVAVIVLSALSAISNALVLKWSVPVGVIVSSTIVNVYSDSSLTTRVTGIDFGTVTKGSQTLTKRLYVKNEGTGPVYVYWNSTLSLVVNLISDSWFSNRSLVNAQSSITGDYRIQISQDIQLGAYNWTLNVWTD